jgi:hypothetical protein
VVHRLTWTTLAVVVSVAYLAAVQSPAAAGAAPRIALRSPHAWQVVQRGPDGAGDLVVSGRLIGVGGRVRVAWGEHRLLVRCDRSGRFVVRLDDLPPGQWTLRVWSTRRPAVTCSRENVAVGDIYVIAGQSNASGRSPHRFAWESKTWRAAAFGNDYRWQELRDPVDSADGQVDRVSRDDNAGGSVWPEVATALLAEEGVPVAFVPCARSSTAIAAWNPERRARGAGGTLYRSMARRVAAVGGRVRAVLWWQGERDARFLTPGPVYRVALARLSAAVWRDFRAPMVVAQIGDYDDRYTAAGVDAVRFAQQRAWAQPHILQGPVLYDIDLEDRVHFADADDVTAAARRWAAAILRGVLRADVGVTPRVLRAELAEGGRQIILTADSELAPAAGLGGFVVRAAGLPVPVESVTAEGRVIRLTLDGDAVGPCTVSLGEGRTAAGAAVPTGPSASRLPMAPFIGLPAVVAAP